MKPTTETDTPAEPAATEKVADSSSGAAADAQPNAGTADPSAPAQTDTPAEPPAQAGDKPVEVAVPEAKPVLQSLEEGKAELAAHPARTAALTNEGLLVRE